jgi:hypothetical protein
VSHVFKSKAQNTYTHSCAYTALELTCLRNAAIFVRAKIRTISGTINVGGTGRYQCYQSGSNSNDRGEMHCLRMWYRVKPIWMRQSEEDSFLYCTEYYSPWSGWCRKKLYPFEVSRRSLKPPFRRKTVVPGAELFATQLCWHNRQNHPLLPLGKIFKVLQAVYDNV